MRKSVGRGKIKAILLDVDGTLYRQGPLRCRMFVELASFTARRPSAGLRVLRILHAFRRMRENLRGILPAGISCEALQFERPAATLGFPVLEVRQVVEDWMQARPLPHLRRYARPGLAPFLVACREHGVTVGALSDYPAREKLAALGILQFFGLVLCSTDPEIDAFKPSPAGVLSACRTWSVAPHELLVVGDRAAVDGEAARTAGSAFVLVGDRGKGGTRDFFDLLRVTELDRKHCHEARA